MFILGNGGIGWRGCIVEMFQLKIIPLFPCFKRVTCQEPAPELAFSYIFIHMWWNWWYPFFLFISETTCPLPSKVRRRGQATPSGLCVRHFVFFLTQWLATATCLAVPQAPQQQHPNPTPPPPPKKKSVDLNLPRITCYLLFSLTFMQLFIHNYKEFPNTHYSWLLSSLKTIPWGCWPLSVLPKAATRITLAA